MKIPFYIKYIVAAVFTILIPAFAFFNFRGVFETYDLGIGEHVLARCILLIVILVSSGMLSYRFFSKIEK